MAYQGARGLDGARILADSEAQFERPDLILVFELSAAEGLARVAARGEGLEPAFENLAFQERVAEAFAALELPGLVRIDAAHDEAEIARSAWPHLQQALDAADPT